MVILALHPLASCVFSCIHTDSFWYCQAIMFSSNLYLHLSNGRRNKQRKNFCNERLNNTINLQIDTSEILVFNTHRIVIKIGHMQRKIEGICQFFSPFPVAPSSSFIPVSKYDLTYYMWNLNEICFLIL